MDRISIVRIPQRERSWFHVPESKRNPSVRKCKARWSEAACKGKKKRERYPLKTIIKVTAEDRDVARNILRKNYNERKNRYNSDGGMRGQGKREKMAMEGRSGKVGQRKRKCARGGETREDRGGGNERRTKRRTKKRWWKSRIGEGRRRFAQRQFINHTTPYYGQTSRPRRAISSFILINNACQESNWVGQALVTETIPPRCYTIPTESHYSHLWKLDLILPWRKKN